MVKPGPTRKGRWCGPYKVFKNCGRSCHLGCNTGKDRPHGPYYIMARRNPTTGKHEQISFGTMEPSDSVVDALNGRYQEREKPTRMEVNDLMGISNYIDDPKSEYTKSEQWLRKENWLREDGTFECYWCRKYVNSSELFLRYQRPFCKKGCCDDWNDWYNRLHGLI